VKVVLLLVAFSGSHTAAVCPYQPVCQPAFEIAPINAFYFAGWGLMGVALIVTALGVRALIQQRRQTASEPS